MKEELIVMALLGYFIGIGFLLIAVTHESYWAAFVALIVIAKSAHWEERRNNV